MTGKAPQNQSRTGKDLIRRNTQSLGLARSNQVSSSHVPSQSAFLQRLVSLLAISCLPSAWHKQTALVIHTPADAASARIAVMTGTTGEMIAKTRFPQADLQTFDNRIISHFRADGTLASMQKRWLKSDLSPYETVKIEFPESGNPLRVGWRPRVSR